jgi:hypothetical protein
MADPWETAADKLRRMHQTSVAQAAQLEEEHRLEAAAREREYTAKKAAMDAAINEAVASLRTFVRERGEAAQALLAAYTDARPEMQTPAHVLFGCISGGGTYRSIVFDRHGIRQEGGSFGGLGGQPDGEPMPATVIEAVRYFAMHGEGKNKPELVRDIAVWLTQKLDRFANGAN